MKKIMLIAAVTIASVSAHASKARLSALQNAEHIVDIQEVFQSEPDQVVNYEAATVEFGGTTGTPNAEGGFIRKMGDSAWSLYLGRSSTTYAAAASQATSLLSDGTGTETAGLNSAFQQDNTMQLTYGSKMGDLAWGLGLFYMSNDFKNATTFSSEFVGTKKQDIMGLLVGANNGTWDVQLRQGLTGTTEISNITTNTISGIAGATKFELNSTNSTKLSGGYKMDTMYFYGGYEMNAGEIKANGSKAAESDSTALTVGVINSHKKDGVDFFYGASVVSSTGEVKRGATTTKTESMLVPILVGVESEVSSWLTLRGSLTQNLGLLSTSKPSGVNQKSGSTANSTISRLGAGFKWGKADIDAVIGAGGTGSFGFDSGTTAAPTNNFANMSVTYTF